MSKLTLSVDQAVVQRAKRYARARRTSVSRLVERFLDLITRDRQATGSARKVFEVAPVDGAVIRSALGLSWPDFEDAVCAAAAAASGCEAIVSRDAAGFRHSPVPAIDPATAVVWLGVE